MLSDAEVLLGLSRHLSAYAMNPSTAALEQLSFAGWVYEMAWRLRGSGASSPERVEAIALEARISRRRLLVDVLPTLETLGWVSVQRKADNTLHAVVEVIPPPTELLGLAESVLEVAMPTATERSALTLLRATTLQPLEVTAALEEASPHGDVAARDALRHLVAIKLVRRIKADDGREVVFNPNIWADNPKVIEAALRAEDARIRAEVGALLEEVVASPGLPESQVSSTDQPWIDFAVAHGLVQRTVVQTTEGAEHGFLFSPHLNRDPFGAGTTDPSGHVRQLVGSMVYAATFPRFKLWSPVKFVRALVRDGEAGDASPIGTDYPMLETAGIVRIVPGSAMDRYRFELLQSEVAEEALTILEKRGGSNTEGDNEAGLRTQRSYVHLERERARLAVDVPVDDTEQARLIAALRDSTARRRYSGF